MTFIAPLIAGALGLGAVGSALVGVGLSVALGYAARALAPRQSNGAGSYGNQGMRLALRYDPSAPREIPIGETATAGTIVYQHLYGPNGNDIAQLVFALADYECDSLAGFTVNGKPVTWNAITGDVTEYTGKMNVRFYRGTWSQTADASLVANSGGRWTANDRGAGICYVVVELTYDAALYQTGVPRFLWRLRGARLYDWRKDSTNGGAGAHRWGQPATYEWSANPIVALYNWRRGFWLNGQRIAGMNTPASALPLDDFTTAADACDEAVALAAGGTEPRYRFNGVVSTADDHREIVRGFMAAAAGREIDSGGVFKPRPGVVRTVVASITDDDLAASGTVEIVPRLPRSQLVNAVFGTWRDPERGFERVAAAPRISPPDELMDGGVRLEATYDIDNVTSRTQAQRVLEVIRREGRHQLSATLQLRPRWLVLEAGDWVQWTSAVHGFTGQTFRVEQAQAGADNIVNVTLRAISVNAYAWSTSDEISETAPAPVGSGAPSLAAVPGLTVTAVSISGTGAAARPGIRATWTPITDATVTHIEFEYRKTGDAAHPMQKLALQPSTGQLMWVDGVQGGIVYEVRARLVTSPPRAVMWSGWIAASAATAPFVVDVGAVTVMPDSITPEMLDAQTRFELSLASAGDATQGAAAQFRDEIIALIQSVSSSNMLAALDADDAHTLIKIERVERVDGDGALALQIETVGARMDTAEAAIQTQTEALASTTTAVATLQTTTTTSLNGLSATIATQQSSIDGLNAQYTVALDVNGRATGFRLAGSATTTDLLFLLDNLRMASPSINGGAPVPLFSVETVVVGGVPQAQMFLNGAIKARALEVASLTAITTVLGDATVSGILRGTANKMILDFNTPRFRMVAA